MHIYVYLIMCLYIYVYIKIYIYVCKQTHISMFICIQYTYMHTSIFHALLLTVCALCLASSHIYTYYIYLFKLTLYDMCFGINVYTYKPVFPRHRSWLVHIYTSYIYLFRSTIYTYAYSCEHMYIPVFCGRCRWQALLCILRESIPIY